jgi:N utilization substance protein B
VTAKKFSPAARHKARYYALQALYQWEMTGDDLNYIERQFRADHDFSRVDLTFFHDLFHQIPKHLTAIEAAFSPYLDREITELTPIERSLLRLGSYELLKRADIPHKVSINEVVNLAKKFGAEDSYKYINAVLDKLAKRVRCGS